MMVIVIRVLLYNRFHTGCRAARAQTFVVPIPIVASLMPTASNGTQQYPMMGFQRIHFLNGSAHSKFVPCPLDI